MDKDFYKKFEQMFRGSHDVIKDRLRFYLPFVLPLGQIHENFMALDLGCGRGEWLDLLNDYDLPVGGVDLDDGMISVALEKGYKVIKHEAVSYLKSLPNESLSLITAFHVVEHIDFDQLQSLVKEAYRVLKSDGILIMETPNPENITVATKSFYLDPTHTHPIPPELLLFLPKYYDFDRAKIVRVQEPIPKSNLTKLSLNNVLAGASQDYSVIAQKKITITSSSLDQAFDQEYGLTTYELADIYSDQITADADDLIEKTAEVEARFNQVEARFNQVEARFNQVRMEIENLYKSRSWRLTAPLRFLGRAVRRVLSFLK